MLNNIRINRKFWINFFFFVAGGILLFYFYNKYRVAPKISSTEMELKTLDGKVVHLSDYKGKVLLLNFWETWCGPCLQEMPTIENARLQLDSTKFAFVTVAEEDLSKITAFRDRNDYRFDYLISGKKFQEMGINAYPTTYIIDPEGNIVLSKIGGEVWDSPEMINRLKALAK